MSETPSPGVLRAGGVAGFLAVFFNILGVVPLGPIEGAYLPGHLGEWFQNLQPQPMATMLSAWAFTLGVLLLVPFANAVRRAYPRSGLVDLGGQLLALGGIMDGASTLTPFVVSRHLLVESNPVASASTGVALLGLTLSMDALCNLMLGLGMLLMGLGLRRSGRRILGSYGIIAGLVTTPVVLQAISEPFARLLGLAGPLWLGWVALASWQLFRCAESARAAEANVA